MIKETAQCVEALVPELLVVREPHGGLPHGFGEQFDANHPPFLLALHQPRFLEHAQVLHETGKGHAVRLRQFRHAGRPLLQALDDVAPRRVRQRPEHAVEDLRHPCPMGSACRMDTRFFSVSKKDT